MLARLSLLRESLAAGVRRPGAAFDADVEIDIPDPCHGVHQMAAHAGPVTHAALHSKDAEGEHRKVVGVVENSTAGLERNIDMDLVCANEDWEATFVLDLYGLDTAVGGEVTLGGLHMHKDFGRDRNMDVETLGVVTYDQEHRKDLER